MNISVIDGVNYLKGLLLLIRKDRRISDSEIRLLRRIGKALGFERTFCDNEVHPSEDAWLRSTAAKNGLVVQYS
jgi:hypothetical protein